MDNDDKTPQAPAEIDVFYQKALSHHYVTANGAWAGITPQADIQVAFFSELQPMPSKVRHKVVDGSLGEEVTKEIEVGILREAQVTILFSPVTAIQIIKLLSSMVEKLKERLPPEIRAQLEKISSEESGINVSGT